MSSRNESSAAKGFPGTTDTFKKGGPWDPEARSAAQGLGNCEEMVWVKPGYWHKFPCTRAAKREVDGRRLCTQHAKVAERRKELHAR